MELLPSRLHGVGSWISEVTERVRDLGSLLGKFPYWDEFLNSVVIVLLVAWIGTWVSERVRTNRLRRTIRESVANELYLNMLILDEYDAYFISLGKGTPGTLPTNKPWNYTLPRTLDPSVLVLLTDTEQVRLSILEGHISRVSELLSSVPDQVNAALEFPPPMQMLQIVSLGEQLHGSELLARAGANIVGAMTQLIPEQGEFVHSPLIEMAQRLEPIVDGRAISQVVWRSSDLHRWPAQGGGVVIVWTNDDPSAVSPGTTLIQLDPGGEDDLQIVDRENENWFVRFVSFPRRRWLARLGIRRSAKHLAKIRSGES